MEEQPEVRDTASGSQARPLDNKRRPRVLPLFLAASFGGAVVALAYLGPPSFTLQGISAIVGAGATYGVVFGAAVYLFQKLPRTAFCAVAALAGAAGGMAWWFVVRPTSSILLAALIGMGLSFITAVFESRHAQPR